MEMARVSRNLDDFGVFDEFVMNKASSNIRWQPVIVYFIIWAVPFLLIVICALGPWLERNEKQTLFGWLRTDKKMGAMIQLFPEHLQGVGYILNHFCVVFTFGLFSLVFWRSFLGHTLYLIGIAYVSIHNGATYVFRIMAVRYAEAQLQDPAIRYSILGERAPEDGEKGNGEATS